MDVNLNNLEYSDSRAQSVSKQIDSITKGDTSFGTVILDDSDSAMAEYIKSLQLVFGPLLVMFLLTLLMYIAFCTQFLCRCCCGKCKRDTLKDPYSRFSVTLCSGFGIFFLLAIFGTSIAGIIYSVSFQTSSQQFECVTYSTFNDLLYGAPKQNWYTPPSIYSF